MESIFDICTMLDATPEIIGMSVTDRHLHVWFDSFGKTYTDMVSTFTKYAHDVDSGAVVFHDTNFVDEVYNEYRALLKNGWSLVTLIKKEGNNG